MHMYLSSRDHSKMLIIGFQISEAACSVHCSSGNLLNTMSRRMEEGEIIPAGKPSSASPPPPPRPPLRESGLPAVHEVIHDVLVALGPCIASSELKPWSPCCNMLRTLNLIILSRWRDGMSALWACPVRCKPLCDATGVKVVLAGEDEELAGRRR
jgi:hypothetical protein